MALVGKLSTMSIPDLLQWLSGAGKTGTLHVERNKVAKTIVLRQGRVIACTTDDPKELLGHFLLSHGKIDEETLRGALARQEETHEPLGAILVQRGAISSEELVGHLSAKTEETIFSLFEWEEGVFRFHDGQVDEELILFPVDLRVEDILLRGLQRLDEMSRIRTVFNDPGIVLRRTDRVPPAALFRNRMATQIYQAIDGVRTVAELLLLTHASEFLVTKFLFELFRSGLAEIKEVRKVPPSPAVPAAPPEAAPVLPQGDAPASERGAPGPAVEVEGRGSPVPASVLAPAAEPAGHEPDPVSATPKEKEDDSPETLARDLEVARRLMGRGEFDAALEILNSAYRAHQGDEALGKLLAEAEASFIDKAYRHLVPGTKVPFLERPAEELTNEEISPEEFFLLSRIDGRWDVKSIVQISPMREVDALRALTRMREKGYIDLRDPA